MNAKEYKDKYYRDNKERISDTYHGYIKRGRKEMFQIGNEYFTTGENNTKLIVLTYKGDNKFVDIQGNIYKAKINRCSNPVEECALIKDLAPVFSRGWL